MKLRKLAGKKSVLLSAGILALTLAASTTSFAATPKLQVQDGSGNTVFSVNDDGTLNINGTDANNAFSFNLLGHTGGDSHTQITTGLADSRLTVMAAQTSDFAPRLQMTGPQDAATSVQGWMIFDYGSASYALPNAEFVLRHFNGTGKDGYAYVMKAVGDQYIAFPTGNVAIGGDYVPTSKLQVTGLPVYADNATATAAGLTPGAFYRTSTGVLMVVY